MITAIEYALLAGASYYDTRAGINRFPLPQNWSYVSRIPPQSSGFEAATFTNGTEIVISFAGTGPGILQPDWIANSALALGTLSQQLKDAADYYLQVKAQNPGATISFTGHSLGGGLAALMAVFFGESAFTFDQAPFRASALTYTTTDPDTGIVTPHSVAQDLLAYLTSNTGQATGLLGYIPPQLQSLASFVWASNTNPGVIPNEGNVTNINVQGEILSSLPLAGHIGTEASIPNSNAGASSVDLHLQALVTAFLQSYQTADANNSFSDVTFKLTEISSLASENGKSRWRTCAAIINSGKAANEDAGRIWRIAA